MEDLREAGTGPSGETVHEFTLEDGRLRVVLLTYGARLRHVFHAGSGDMVRGRADLGYYIDSRPYSSPVVAPVVNRITDARVTVGGTVYTMDPNQAGRHCLHSGKQGAHRKVWTIEERSGNRVLMSVEFPDMDCGLPGNRRVTVEYRLDGDDLHVVLEGTTDQLTLMNPALHGVWNLDGAEEWRGHRLTVPAERVLEIDEMIVPTGRILDVAGTELDLRGDQEPPATIDHNYCFDPVMGLRAILTGRSGRRMTISSDAPGLQVFTRFAETIALEPQIWPDAPNHEGFPSILLAPGETFRQTSVYSFSA